MATKTAGILQSPKPEPNGGKKKSVKNISNDIKNQTLLKEMGYKVIIVWGCEIKDKSIFNDLIYSIIN